MTAYICIELHSSNSELLSLNVMLYCACFITDCVLGFYGLLLSRYILCSAEIMFTLTKGNEIET